MSRKKTRVSRPASRFDSLVSGWKDKASMTCYQEASQYTLRQCASDLERELRKVNEEKDTPTVSYIKTEPPDGPFSSWWRIMLAIHPTIDTQWEVRDVADIAFAAGYNYAKSQNAKK